jgi:hypothetical protein
MHQDLIPSVKPKNACKVVQKTLKNDNYVINDVKQIVGKKSHYIRIKVGVYVDGCCDK